MRNIFLTNITYDLEKDLQLVSETYHKYLDRNQKILLLAFQERNTNPSIAEKTATNPKILKDYLIGYFTEMQKRNKVREENPEIMAMNFLWVNLGYFMSQFVAGEKVAQIDKESFIKQSVKVFVRGIQV
ncbi:MAG: hypothetical protein LRY73_00345 [Bacillus sp. (in: Bacteria)]|nr:hypothetical protein [Bacillus sp. (in: firmicutes)]